MQVVNEDMNPYQSPQFPDRSSSLRVERVPAVGATAGNGGLIQRANGSGTGTGVMRNPGVITRGGAASVGGLGNPGIILPPPPPGLGRNDGLRVGGLEVGGVKVTGLELGRLIIGGLRVGGLEVGRLRIGGLEVGRLRIGGLEIGGLETGRLRIGGLEIGGLEIGGLRVGGLRVGGLRIGGLRIGGLRIGGLGGGGGNDNGLHVGLGEGGGRKKVKPKKHVEIFCGSPASGSAKLHVVWDCDAWGRGGGTLGPGPVMSPSSRAGYPDGASVVSVVWEAKMAGDVWTPPKWRVPLKQTDLVDESPTRLTYVAARKYSMGTDTRFDVEDEGGQVTRREGMTVKVTDHVAGAETWVGAGPDPGTTLFRESLELAPLKII